MGVGGHRHVPAALPPGMTRYPLYRRLGGPYGRPGRVLKMSPPPGFDPRTVQVAASRYTDWAIPAHTCICTTRFQPSSKGELYLLYVRTITFQSTITIAFSSLIQLHVSAKIKPFSSCKVIWQSNTFTICIIKQSVRQNQLCSRLLI